jgi:hypothetical protein
LTGRSPDGVLMLVGDALIVPDPIRLPWMF